MNKCIITKDLLEDSEPGALLYEGTTTDSAKGINMNRTGKTIRFVVVRGEAPDWAVYCGPLDWSIDKIAREGSKVIGRQNLENIAAFDYEVAKMYRF